MGRLAKVSYSHDAMIDLVIGNPAISQNEIAATFGYTVGWVSNVFASDAFRERMAQRKDELIDPTLRLTIEERFKALVQRSLDVLQEKLARPSHAIPDNLALQAAALGARSLGLGRPDNTTPPAPNGDRLQQLAGRLIILQRNVVEKVQNGKVTEGEISETLYDSGGSYPGGRAQSERDLPEEGAV